MNCDPATTACFTGHRIYKGERNEVLMLLLRRLYAEGFRTFVSGMAVGFDLAAAECVLTLREEHPDAMLFCAVPFKGQEDRFSSNDKARYGAVLSRASVVVYLCSGYVPQCYALRNNFLVDNASVVVAWYDGSPGGTHYTVRRARRTGRRVINLYDC